MTGRHPWVSGWQGPSRQDEEIVQEQLCRVGLECFSERMVTTLSGGERRRMEIAALGAQQTPVVLLDEPVNHLDLHYQVDLMGVMLKEWQRRGCAVMMVMHDLNLALRFSNRCFLVTGRPVREMWIRSRRKRLSPDCWDTLCDRSPLARTPSSGRCSGYPRAWPTLCPERVRVCRRTLPLLNQSSPEQHGCNPSSRQPENAQGGEVQSEVCDGLPDDDRANNLNSVGERQKLDCCLGRPRQTTDGIKHTAKDEHRRHDERHVKVEVFVSTGIGGYDESGRGEADSGEENHRYHQQCSPVAHGAQ